MLRRRRHRNAGRYGARVEGPAKLPLTAKGPIQAVTEAEPGAGLFEVLPRRWAVERTFARLNRNRRLAKDFGATIDSAAAFLYAASVMLLTRRLSRSL